MIKGLVASIPVQIGVLLVVAGHNTNNDIVLYVGGAFLSLYTVLVWLHTEVK